MSQLSRRSLIASAATLPALAASTAVAVAAPTILSAVEANRDPIIDLAERTIRAWEDHGAAIDIFEVPDLAMMDWSRKNPAPTLAQVSGPKSVKAEYDGNGRVLNRKEVGEYFVKLMDKQPEAEVAAETAAQKRAMANWRRRERAAKRRTGYTKADAEAAAACHI
jgi:hypothetical protein